jgi:hypothetical protein
LLLLVTEASRTDAVPDIADDVVTVTRAVTVLAVTTLVDELGCAVTDGEVVKIVWERDVVHESGIVGVELVERDGVSEWETDGDVVGPLRELDFVDDANSVPLQLAEDDG